MTKHSARNRSNSPNLRRPSRPPRRDLPGGAIWLWGQHAVEAALANPNRHLHRLVATRNGAQKLGKFAARAEDCPPREIDGLLPPGAVHQGIAGLFDPLPETALEDLISAGAERLVILDQVSDPHNMGAIFRSASAFGFSGVILQTRNAPPITGIVAKSAAGAVETVKECRVVNIARALDTLGEAGYHTVGMAGEGRATIEHAVRGAARLAIVMGAEGPGLRPAVAKACAEVARIPIAAEMESLNVSNAAAIAFYEATRQAG